MKRLPFILISFLMVSCVSNSFDHKISLVWDEAPDTYPVWRGERKSLCANLNAEADLSNVRVSVSNLKSAKGAIKASAIKAQFVSPVMADVIDTMYFAQCGFRPVGMYDSLYVNDILDIIPSKNIAAGTKQPIWLTISVPQNTPQGIYEGKLTIKADKSSKVDLPIKIEVLSEVLPLPKDWKFHLDLWQNPYSVARYHNVEPWSKEHFEAMRPVMELLAKAGQRVVTATIMDRPWDGQTEDAFGSMVTKTKYANGEWKYDFSVFDKWVEFMFSLGIDKQVNCYSMIPWKLTFDYINGETGKVEYVTANPEDAEYAYYWGSFIKAFASHLKQKGWFEKVMIAMDERPMEAMRSSLGLIKLIEPDFKVALAGNYHPEIEESIDDYCIALQQHFPAEVLSKRKAEGKISTYYTCCAEAYPNTFLASDPKEATWLSWFAVANNYDGYLRWAYNSWTKEPLKDTRFRKWPAGDCFLVYPEGRSSVRFERLMEGIQDYEKAHILMERWQKEGNGHKLNQMHQALEYFNLEELKANGSEQALRRVKKLINPTTQISSSEVNVIFDTDIGGDIDDVLALQMVLNYHLQGKINLNAVTIVKDNRKSISLVDGICRFNSCNNIPIGFCFNGVDKNDYYYLIPTLDAINSKGSRLINPQIDTNSVEEAYRLIRKKLVENKGKTTLIAVGPLTNIQNLINSGADDISPKSGIELIKDKVDRLLIMGGMFDKDNFFAEWNIKVDIKAAQDVFAKCPVQLVALGWEVGAKLLYPHTSVLNDFGSPKDHPLSVAYCAYATMPYDRPSWDEATVYVALEKGQTAFEESPKGTITIDDEGYSHFLPNENGKHCYVILPKGGDVFAMNEIVKRTIPIN